MRFDIIPSGHKPVRHLLVLETAPGVACPPLVAHPVSGFGGAATVRPGEPFTFSTKYGTRLYTLQAGESAPTDLDPAWRTAHAATAIPVSQIASLPMLSPIDEVRTTLIVEGVESGVLRLRAADEAHVSSASSWAPILILALIAAAGVVGLMWFARRMRARGRCCA